MPRSDPGLIGEGTSEDAKQEEISGSSRPGKNVSAPLPPRPLPNLGREEANLFWALLLLCRGVDATSREGGNPSRSLQANSSRLNHGLSSLCSPGRCHNHIQALLFTRHPGRVRVPRAAGNRPGSIPGPLDPGRSGWPRCGAPDEGLGGCLVSPEGPSAGFGVFADLQDGIPVSCPHPGAVPARAELFLSPPEHSRDSPRAGSCGRNRPRCHSRHSRESPRSQPAAGLGSPGSPFPSITPT